MSQNFFEYHHHSKRVSFHFDLNQMMNLIEPSDNDIKLGRGGKHYMHRGNERLRAKAEEMELCYDRASKEEKGTIINSIRNELLQQGVRFLYCVRPIGQQQYWEEATKEKAREKVSQELREAKKNRIKREKLTSVASVDTHHLYESDSELSSIQDTNKYEGQFPLPCMRTSNVIPEQIVDRRRPSQYEK